MFSVVAKAHGPRGKGGLSRGVRAVGLTGSPASTRVGMSFQLDPPAEPQRQHPRLAVKEAPGRQRAEITSLGRTHQTLVF